MKNEWKKLEKEVQLTIVWGTYNGRSLTFRLEVCILYSNMNSILETIWIFYVQCIRDFIRKT